ncbi:hypothetical protein N431DRAFT_431995 [Stipitochalara longipes BDJ]|nr:hypothetical protein N431DRAFT_431995 [Stipitochalara longipes BDJ]
MAPITWDAYRTLNITSRDSHGMSCVGDNRFGQRCRWDIPGKKFSQICSILDGFETEAPAKAVPALRHLAELSLCEQFHQNQVLQKREEWKIAIQEATKFYENGKDLKEKNRELKRMLKEEREEREDLEREFEAETARTKQELKSIGSMSLEVSSLREKLNQAETEARDSKEVAQKWSKAYHECVADREKCISTLQAAWNDGNQKMVTTLKEEGEKAIRAIRSESKKVEMREKTLVTQVSELTEQLNDKLHANNTLQSELGQMKNERNTALSQMDEFKSQLELATEKIDQIGLGLQKAEAARVALSEEKQDLQARLSIENTNLKTISESKSQLEETKTALVQEMEALSTQLSSERHNAAELRQSLQTATDNLSRTQTQLKTVNEELSHNKDELEKLQVEFTQARQDSEEERRRLSMQQAASLARMEELIQEISYAKLHPFRTFFANLFEVATGWVKSVFACFGRMKTRKMFDRTTMEENMPSP